MNRQPFHDMGDNLRANCRGCLSSKLTNQLYDALEVGIRDSDLYSQLSDEVFISKAASPSEADGSEGRA